jgi:hypothetical protein
MPKRALHQTAEAQCLTISSNQLHVVEDEEEDEEELDDDPLTLELEPELPVVEDPLSPNAAKRRNLDDGGGRGRQGSAARVSWHGRDQGRRHRRVVVAGASEQGASHARVPKGDPFEPSSHTGTRANLAGFGWPPRPSTAA